MTNKELMQQAEPVAWMCSDVDLVRRGYKRFSERCEGAWNIPVYTAPPRREWVGLTDEQIDEMWREATTKPALTSEFVRAFARAIEAALKARNA